MFQQAELVHQPICEEINSNQVTCLVFINQLVDLY
jgi:hypothetical protein